MLRGSTELKRYEIKATDGMIGSLNDFYFDDQSWSVHHIVLETGGFFSSRKVLLKPDDVVNLLFPEETMVLSLSKVEVKARPRLDAGPHIALQDKTTAIEPSAKFGDAIFRSEEEICSYRIAAMDRLLGSVHELIIDTAAWKIRYLVADTGEWLRGKLVLLAPTAIHAIDANAKTLSVSVTSEIVRHSPAYDGTAELNREIEAFLCDYYGWTPYWE